MAKATNVGEVENLILEALRLLLENEEVLQTAIEEFDEIDLSKLDCRTALWTAVCSW